MSKEPYIRTERGFKCLSARQETINEPYFKSKEPYSMQRDLKRDLKRALSNLERALSNLKKSRISTHKDYKINLPVRKETIKEPYLISKEPCSV